jgi:hypothetical protein
MRHRTCPLASKRDVIAAMLDSGLTYAEVGARFGITRQRVGQIAATLGIHRREPPVEVSGDPERESRIQRYEANATRRLPLFS